MSRLINDTIEAYNLFIEGELSIEELEYGIEIGLISESLLLELDTTILNKDVDAFSSIDKKSNKLNKEGFKKSINDFDFSNYHYNMSKHHKLRSIANKLIRNTKKAEYHRQLSNYHGEAAVAHLYRGKSNRISAKEKNIYLDRLHKITNGIHNSTVGNENWKIRY